MVHNILSKGTVQAGNLVQIPGQRAMAILYVPANVADAQTVTIGTDVYEFDRAANGVVAGRIPVTGHADDTPANATNALIAAINASGTMPVTAIDGGATEVIVVHNLAGEFPITLAETLAGAANVWSVAALAGGERPRIGKMQFCKRVPTATEVTLGVMRFAYDFEPLSCQVRVHVTATGVQKLWDGNADIDATNMMISLDNGGGTDWAATDTVSVIAIG